MFVAAGRVARPSRGMPQCHGEPSYLGLNDRLIPPGGSSASRGDHGRCPCFGTSLLHVHGTCPSFCRERAIVRRSPGVINGPRSHADVPAAERARRLSAIGRLQLTGPSTRLRDPFCEMGGQAAALPRPSVTERPVSHSVVRQGEDLVSDPEGAKHAAGHVSDSQPRRE
jgi:hypothetical protein